MRPFDYIFIVLAIILSFIPNVITAYQMPAEEEEPQIYANVKIMGNVVDTFELEEGQEQILKTYYPNPGQYNIIEVNDGAIRIKEDNSPDQIGVNTGWIYRPGQTAICLPHGLVLEVKGEIAEDDPLILP
ncbi:hypothetical protein CL176_10865 [Suicoccus acidiformans]|uniref:Uncharacterized protein n=2 Tax=Suicoccus acidiformans TaxID=2036206 RepID=A0A347WNX2_9LACT|nr:hypothetical protein CL176_10865 [Suicoccus acidiformans]